MIEVEAPDGSVVEFPDGTSREVMAAAMRKKFGAPTAGPQEATGGLDKAAADKLYEEKYALTGMTKNDFYDQIGLSPEVAPRTAGGVEKIGRQLVPGVWRGLGQLKDAALEAPLRLADMPANLVIDPVNAGLRLVGVDAQIPRADSVAAFREATAPLEQSAIGRAVNQADQAVGEYLGGAPEPTSEAERIAAYTGELLGTAIPFAAAPYVGTASTAAPQNVLQGLWQTMQRNAAARPVETAISEAIGATGAGIGGGIAREAAPDSPTAELAGQLLGGVAPALAPGVMVTRLGRKAWQEGKNYVSADAQAARANQKVRETIGDIAPLEPGIARSQEIEAAINKAAGPAPMKLSLAERTGTKSLVEAQKDMESRFKGPELDVEIARREANQDAISAFARQVAPKSAADAESVISAAGRRGQAITQKIDKAATAAEMERYALAGKVPTTDLAEQGRALRTELESARNVVRDRFNQRAAAEGLDDVDISLGFKDFQNQVAEKYAPKEFDNPQYRPRVLDDIVDYKPEAVSFQDARNLRERLTTDLRVAQRSSNPTDRERAKRLSQVLRDFDDMIVNAELRNASPETASKWSAFRRDYKTEFVDKFRTPEMKDIRAKDVDGFEQMADEAVAAEVFKPGSVTMARRFKNAIEASGDDGAYVRAMQSVEAVAMDSLNKAAVRNGQVDPRLLETWKRQHQSILDEFPYLRSQVDDLRNANNAVLSRQAQLDSRRKAVQRSVMERRIAAVETGARSPEGLIDEAVRNQGIARRLVARLRNDKEAMAGLRQAVWDKVPLDDPKATLKFIAENNQSLSAILTPKHLADIETIVAARTMANAVPTPTGDVIDPSPFAALEEALGSSLPSLSASFRAIERGRSTPFYEVPARVLQWWRARANAKADEVWKRALYDPDVARTLVQAQENPKNAAVQERLRRSLWHIGLSLDPNAPNARLPAGVIQADPPVIDIATGEIQDQ